MMDSPKCCRNSGVVTGSERSRPRILQVPELKNAQLAPLAGIAAATAAVSWLQEHRGWQRRWTAPAAGLASWSLGIVVALSFNVWSDVRPLAVVPLLSSEPIDLLAPIGPVLSGRAWLMTEGRLIAVPNKLLEALRMRLEQAGSPVPLPANSALVAGPVSVRPWNF